jgi:hypothetical protein
MKENIEEVYEILRGSTAYIVKWGREPHFVARDPKCATQSDAGLLSVINI